MPKKLWVESHRPSTIKEYVFQNESQKELIEKFISEKSIPHLLLQGHRGTGKTSLAHILKNELGVENCDFKIQNASDDNSVESIRTTIKSFASNMALGGGLRIIFLDEADFLTQNAQGALRAMMEKHSDNVRFILTCNKPHKIIPELKSRCTILEFKDFNKKDMAVHSYKILKAEGVEVSSAEVLMEYVDDAYPDMRKLLQNLEINSRDGHLKSLEEVSDNDALMVSIIEELNKGRWMEVRANIVSGIEGSDWEEIYTFLYDYLDEVEGFDDAMNWKKGILIIAEHLRFHGMVADPEINFTACMIKLSGVVK